MPLTIATLRVGAGRIGVCALPGLDAPLADDLARIADWTADTVISMTEATEGRTPEIGAALPDGGTQWIHLPVQDFDIPTGDTQANWEAVEAVLLHRLAAGGAVLVHCRGGRGRSGMIALRLMVRSGEEGAAALTRLRAARPGAVETPEQLAWALSPGDAP